MIFRLKALSQKSTSRACFHIWTAFAAALLCSTTPTASAQEFVTSTTNQAIDNYLIAIEEAESEGGPYSLDLIDLYHGYGQELMDHGELEEALDAFQQTAIVTRVNHGPYSPEQTNYLYSVAEVETLLGDPEKAIDILQFIYEINVRDKGADNPDLLVVLDELDRWYNEVRPLRALMSRATDFHNTSFIAARRATLTAEKYGVGSREAAEAYRAQGQLHFRAILYLLRNPTVPVTDLMINDGSLITPWAAERSLSNHMNLGVEAFEMAIQSWTHIPNATSIELGEAIAQLGDWYLVLERFRAAGKQYEQAYNLVAANGEHQALADAYFGEPAPLRFLRSEGPFIRSLDPPASNQGFEVIMNVSRDGRISEVGFNNVPTTESLESMDKVRARLERTRFRPAVVSGEATAVDQYAWRPPMQSSQPGVVEETDSVEAVSAEPPPAVPEENPEPDAASNQGPENS